MTKHVPLFQGLPPDPGHLIPGSFYLRKIEGRTGRCISAAQAFVRGGSNWTHAGLVLDRGQIIEAEPGGAKIKSAERLWDFDPVLISDAPMQRWLGSRESRNPLGTWEHAEATKRAEIVGKARFLEGVPYSFLDYVAITAVEFNWPLDRWLTDRVEDSGHLICSAAVDRAYLWCDIHLFDDKPYRWDPNKSRVVGDVTPWDLEQFVLRYEADRLRDLALSSPPSIYQEG